jgi:nucleoside-diphosphate-sugar epimerase
MVPLEARESDISVTGTEVKAMGKRFFLFGLGFSGRVIARRLRDRGWQVTGTTRSGEGADFAFDRDHPLPAHALDGITHILSSVPPDGRGDPVLDLLGDRLKAEWLGYLSTTGVYGDCGGGWVDEASPVNPTLERSRRRAEAERGWLAKGAHVFRLAGIYGPGRSALDNVRDGTARRIVKPGQVFSRIHVEDIAATVLASMEHPNPGAIYNVCDDDPAPPQEVVEHACRLLGQEPPPEIPFDQAELSPMAQSFYADNKRVRNDRIKTELGVRLRFPSYREGLKDILNSGDSRSS